MTGQTDSASGRRRIAAGTRPNAIAMTRGVVCVLVLGLLAACTRTPPEEALRETVARMQQHIEARDASGLHDLLDDDFAGPDGLDRRAARQMATVMLMRHRRIGLTLGPLDVQMQGDDRARVRATAALTGSSGAVLPDSARAYRIESAWRRRGDDWTLLSLQWTPIGG